LFNPFFSYFFNNERRPPNEGRLFCELTITDYGAAIHQSLTDLHNKYLHRASRVGEYSASSLSAYLGWWKPMQFPPAMSSYPILLLTSSTKNDVFVVRKFLFVVVEEK
jgi:hypothetical protein